MGGGRAVLVGYMRVSTVEQNLDLQRDALERAGCERLYEVKAIAWRILSGSVRPQLPK